MQLRTPPPARRVHWEMPPTNFQPSPYYHAIKMEAWKLSKMMLQMYTNVWAGIKGPWSVQTILQLLGQSQGVTLSVRQWLLGPQTTSTNLERLFHQSVAEGTNATGCYRFSLHPKKLLIPKSPAEVPKVGIKPPLAAPSQHGTNGQTCPIWASGNPHFSNPLIWGLARKSKDPGPKPQIGGSPWCFTNKPDMFFLPFWGSFPR